MESVDGRRPTIFQSPFLPAVVHYEIHDAICNGRVLKSLLCRSKATKERVGAIETARHVCRGEIICAIEYASELLLFPAARAILFKQFVYSDDDRHGRKNEDEEDDMIVCEKQAERHPVGTRFTVCIAIEGIRANTLLFKTGRVPNTGIFRSLHDILFEDTRRFGRFLLDNETTLRGDDKEAQFRTYMESIDLAGAQTNTTTTPEIALPGIFLVPHWLDDELRLFGQSRLLVDVRILTQRLARLDHGLALARSTIPFAGDGVFVEQADGFEPGQLVTFFSGQLVERRRGEAMRDQHYRIAFSHNLVLLGDRTEGGEVRRGGGGGDDGGAGAFINDCLNVNALRTKMATLKKTHRLTRYDTESIDNQHRGTAINVATHRIDDLCNLLHKVNREPLDPAHRLIVVTAAQYLPAESELFLAYGPDYWREEMTEWIDLC